MFSRFGNGEGWEGGLNGMGIHPTYWPDSKKEAFEWMCNDTVVRTNDWYAHTNICSPVI
jgi:1-phosphatidylinositol phosphodiesterase